MKADFHIQICAVYINTLSLNMFFKSLDIPTVYFLKLLFVSCLTQAITHSQGRHLLIDIVCSAILDLMNHIIIHIHRFNSENQLFCDLIDENISSQNPL